MTDLQQSGFGIGDWEVYPQENRLKGLERECVLEPKVMDVLVLLAQRQGEVVSRQQILDFVWAGVVVGDEVVSRAVSLLRTELGDNQKNPRFLETISKRGYRLIADVTSVSSNEPQQVGALSDASASATAENANDSIARRGVRKLSFTIATVLALALAYFAYDIFLLQPESDTNAGYTGISIAVLPFVNMSADSDNEYFSDGLSEELLNLLAKIPELRVAARTSSFSYKVGDVSITQIGEELNVTHVLEGSVRKDGNQIRITAQLVEVENGFHLWSESFDKQLDNIFQIQDDIASAVVGALRITLLGEVPKTRKTDPAAYQLFLEGQYLKRQISNDSLHRAIEAFKQAVEIDPSYVPAWAELADTYIWAWGSEELSIEERTARADHAIQTAISTDPDYAFAYYVRGISWIFTKHRFDKGIEDFELALKLDPDDAFIVAAIGKGALLTGQFDLAISQYQAALAMEPIVPEFYFFLGMAYMSSGRLDDAEASFRTMSSLSPSSGGQNLLWEALFLKGELEAAQAVSDNSFTRAITHHASGNAAVADEALADLIENYYPYLVAKAYGYRGEVDKTFEWLNKLLENSDDYPTFILADMAFVSVHLDPRWELLLEKLGLLKYWLEMTPD